MAGRTIGVRCDADATEMGPEPRVLIVDDHDVLADALALALRARGFDEVSVARDLSTAGVLAAAESIDANFALVDYFLGDQGTGFDAISALADRGILVLALTASKEPEDLAHCLEAGAFSVFDKSRPLDELTSVLSNAALGFIVMRPAVRDALLEQLSAPPARQGCSARPVPFADAARGRGPRRARRRRNGRGDRPAARRRATDRRTQISSVLRKLGVNSQLAAVALVHRSGWRLSDRSEADQTGRSEPAS